MNSNVSLTEEQLVAAAHADPALQAAFGPAVGEQGVGEQQRPGVQALQHVDRRRDRGDDDP
jgi:hypothetical protein